MTKQQKHAALVFVGMLAVQAAAKKIVGREAAVLGISTLGIALATAVMSAAIG
jgi:hypothetical protein